jgi:hypothetical protein
MSSVGQSPPALTRLLILIAIPMSACILPVAPEFQDPPASPNYAPVLVDSKPRAGSIVTGTPEKTLFTITVLDPNVGDTLHIRWLADYPLRNGNTRTLAVDQLIANSTTGQDVTFDVNCGYSLAPLDQHQITAIVADRGFQMSQQGDETALVDPAGLSIQATWFLNLSCTPPAP